MDERQKRPEAPENEAKEAKRTVTIEVNKRGVVLKKHRVSGLEIKQAAIDQGVPHVAIDFQLMEVGRAGAVRTIADSEVITVTKKSKFRMVAPDDNSGL